VERVEEEAMKENEHVEMASPQEPPEIREVVKTMIEELLMTTQLVQNTKFLISQVKGN
jgi:hypothetical protein